MKKSQFASTSAWTRVAHRIVLLALLGLSFATGPARLFAQTDTGQISGTVTDPTGALIPNASITVRNLGTGAVRTDTSSGTGAYLVTGLEPGTYEVTVSTSAFKPFMAKAQVTVGGHITLDSKLTLGQSTTVVEVVGEGGAAVNTSTQELSQVVDREQISQFPESHAQSLRFRRPFRQRIER